MPAIVDTCGWIEWLTDGALSSAFEPWMQSPTEQLAPTVIQFELYKWVKREAGESKAMEVIAATEQCQILPLDGAIALLAADLALEHRLSFGDCSPP
ncbi:PIN domain-containing protein [Halomonas sp. NO4]|uniref:PIN domain-containing protein n=1 Tax=Halomonas sp. NO4 TaxID=2484813 RepID=UPI0013D87C5F|nr:PIN domain-containing protein [Halomonas sp. NO4]